MDRGDMVAAEAKYHHSCNTQFYNRYKAFIRSRTTKDEKDAKLFEERAYLELVDWIKFEGANGREKIPMSEIVRLYDERRRMFNLSSPSHATRLKEKLLNTFGSDLKEEGTHKQQTLTFTGGLNSLLQDVKKVRNYDQDMRAIQNTANLIREDMFDHNGFKFDGKFDENCQKTSVPSSLITLVSMLIYGSSITEEHNSQAALTMSQTTLFNAKKRGPTKTLGRHVAQREPPLALFLGLMIHAFTRSKRIINLTYAIGLSVSYHRVLQVEKQLGSSLSERYRKSQIVFPPNAKLNTFTVCAVDNIDQNSTSAQKDLHATMCTVHQHSTDS